MLCQFTFKNFKSYRDETVFDLQAANIPEHAESLLSSKKDKKYFVPVSVLYGPNGGGKSGVLEALNCLVSHIMEPIWLMEKGSYRFTMKYDSCQPFRFNNTSVSEPTEFTVFFRNGAYEYRFYIALHDGTVVAESLHKRNIGGKNTATIFERDQTGIRLGASMKKRLINTKINAKMPYLSFLAINHSLEVISMAVEWFSRCAFINYANPVMSETHFYIPEFKDSLLAMMCEIDIAIVDYIITYKTDEDGGGDSIDQIYTKRKVGNQEFSLNFFDESQGSIKLFGLLSYILYVFHNGGLMVIDELDSGLHPKLIRYIVKLFRNRKLNRHNAQLLFTSHDITTMKSDIFRRDEIWFAAKDAGFASEIYSLYEIRNPDGSRIRENVPYGKQYLEGRYGADPYLAEMLSLRWEEEQ